MASPVFDTLKAANSLKAAGFDDRQAEAVVITVGGAMIGNLVTKPDLDSALSVALEPMVTKDYLELYLDKRLEPMVTKDYLELYLDKLLEPMVTKDYLELYLDKLLEPMVTKDYLELYLDKRLEPMATRSDLQLVQHQMTTRLGALVVAGVGVLGILIGLF